MKHLFRNINIFVFPENQDQALRLAGQNKKAVLIIFRAGEMSDQLLPFLGKVLGALQLDLEEDTHHIDITTHAPISFSLLSSRHAYKKAIIFGVQPEELGLRINARPYLPFRLGGTHFLFADELKDIYQERQEGKKKMAASLWKALQSIF